jgi:hypothetical protein
MHLDAFPQRFGTGLAQGFLHATQRLLFRAIGILQFLSKQFPYFRFHIWSSCVSWSRAFAIRLPCPVRVPRRVVVLLSGFEAVRAAAFFASGITLRIC